MVNPDILGTLLMVTTIGCLLVGSHSMKDWTSSKRSPVYIAALVVFGVVFIGFGVAVPLSRDNMTALLFNVFTVSGIALSLVFAFVITGYFNAKTILDATIADLRTKQRVLNLFKELCVWSTHSHQIWSDIDKTNYKLPEDEYWDTRPSYHETLYRSIALLAEGAHSEYANSEKGQTLITLDDIYDAQHHINTIWTFTGGDSKWREVRDWLDQIGQSDRLVAIDIPYERYKQSLDPLKGGQSYSTLNDWNRVSEEMFDLCEEMKVLHRKVKRLSPLRSVPALSRMPLLVVCSVVLPLLLVSFDFAVSDGLFVLVGYLMLFAIVVITSKTFSTLHDSFSEDFYESYILNDDPALIKSQHA